MHRLLLGTLTASVVLLTGACGGEPEEPTSTPSADSMSGVESSPDLANSPTPSPSVPTVAPATGPVITSPAATVNTPDDFKGTPSSTSTGGNLNGLDARYNVLLNDTEVEIADPTPDGAAKNSQRFSVIRPPLTRQPDTTMAGMPAYHLAGKDSNFGTWADEFGLYVDGHAIRVIISTPLDLPQAERDAIAAPVLASVTLTP